MADFICNIIEDSSSCEEIINRFLLYKYKSFICKKRKNWMRAFMRFPKGITMYVKWISFKRWTIRFTNLTPLEVNTYSTALSIIYINWKLKSSWNVGKGDVLFNNCLICSAVYIDIYVLKFVQRNHPACLKNMDTQSSENLSPNLKSFRFY